ncbi:unnamed protein product, partial [Prorocentrum cordatum]
PFWLKVVSSESAVAPGARVNRPSSPMASTPMMATPIHAGFMPDGSPGNLQRGQRRKKTNPFAVPPMQPYGMMPDAAAMNYMASAQGYFPPPMYPDPYAMHMMRGMYPPMPPMMPMDVDGYGGGLRGGGGCGGPGPRGPAALGGRKGGAGRGGKGQDGKGGGRGKGGQRGRPALRGGAFPQSGLAGWFARGGGGPHISALPWLAPLWASWAALVATAGFASKSWSERTPGDVL